MCGKVVLVVVMAASISSATASAQRRSSVEQSGLILNTLDAYPGYTLFSPLDTSTTYLVDNTGAIVQVWDTGVWPNNSVYLLESGVLLQTLWTGGVAEFDWDSQVLWRYDYANQHHDVERLPNGNILMIAWDMLSWEEAVAAGRDPEILGSRGTLWIDHLIEVDANTNAIVWEWHLYDHVIQDHSPDKDNYGVVANHSELVDINYTGGSDLFYDFTHVNAVDYHPEWDQIILSSRRFSEIWIIDHSTTTAEAAGHTAGRYGRGGDLLYRWGNPQAHDRGTDADRQLYGQHDAQWITSELPGAGHVLLFNNGDRLERPYSTVMELELPVDPNGFYDVPIAGGPEPNEPVWEYMAEVPEDFFGNIVSGVQRLPNGNTLICEGPSGRFFEVTYDGRIVWEYVNPITGGEGSPMVFRATRIDLDYPGLPSKKGSGTFSEQNRRFSAGNGIFLERAGGRGRIGVE